MSDTQCINCGNLGSCTETSPEKVLSGYFCANWKEVDPEIYAARIKTVNLFGRQGIQAVIQKDLKKDA